MLITMSNVLHAFTICKYYRVYYLTTFDFEIASVIDGVYLHMLNKKLITFASRTTEIFYH